MKLKKTSPTAKVSSASSKVQKISRTTGLPVDRKRSLAAKKAAATRKANSIALEQNREVRLHHKILLAGGIVTAVLFAFFGIQNELQTYAATTANGTFVGLAGKCLDNDHSLVGNGNAIQLWRCNGTNAQKWSVGSDGTITSGNGDGTYCLDIPNGNASEYAYLQLYKCNGTKSQVFTVSGGALKSAINGYCATVRYSNSENGTRIWLNKCAKTLTKAQTWKYDGSTGSGSGTTAPAPVQTPSPTPTPTPTPAPTANYNLTDVTKNTASNKVLALNNGTYTFRNFNTTIGVDMTKLAGLTGAGVGSTVIKMVEKSSTRASSVPSLDGKYNKDAAKTNPLYLLKFDGSPIISGFTLQGTNQGHLYNGLRIDRTTNARVSDIKIASIPGNSDVPPGETFGLNDYGSNGSVYKNIEIDGSGVGSSSFATNSSKNASVSDSFFYNSRYGNGAAFWKTSGTTTITNVKSTGNKDFGFNFERVSGTVISRNNYTCNNKDGDYRMSNDNASAVYKIYDPKFCGSKLVMRVAPKYDGEANKQKRSDIHVYVNGVEKTDSIVKFIN